MWGAGNRSAPIDTKMRPSARTDVGRAAALVPHAGEEGPRFGRFPLIASTNAEQTMVHSNAQRRVRAMPSILARTSGRLSVGADSPCSCRAHAGSISTAACIVSACSGSANMFGARRVNTRRATSRVRASQSKCGCIALIWARASARPCGIGSAPNADAIRAISMK